MKTLWTLIAVSWLAASNCPGQSPVISHAIPSAAAPGTTTTVTFFGENLSGATELWTSFAAQSVLVPGDGGTTLVCRLTVPAAVPVSIGAVRLVTSNGVSSLHLFMIDDLPSVAGRSKTTNAPQVLKSPVAIDGRCEELKSDYYKFSGRKGEQMSVEIVARRLGSRLDPLLRLLDANGREWIYCDDTPGIGPDARFCFRFPHTGEYLLEVRDMNYQGGAPYRYRLRLGDFPLATTPFPLAAPRGTKAKFSFAGMAVAGVKPVAVQMPDAGMRAPLGVKFPHGNGSGFVSALVSDLPEMVEAEPNDAKPCLVPVPVAINGQFTKPRDRDCYQFDVKEGQRLAFRARTRSLGSPCDLWMKVEKADGKKIAESQVTSAEEGSITNTFKEAGAYRLIVEEATWAGGPELTYRVEIQSFQPSFALSVDTDRVAATNGGSFEIKVTPVRSGYDGPITLSVPALGENVALENNVIVGKTNVAVMKVKLPPRFSSGQCLHFQVEGRANVSDQPQVVPASTLPALRRIFSQLRYPPADLDGPIALAIIAPTTKPPPKLAADESE
jgi:hypothetical protein